MAPSKHFILGAFAALASFTNASPLIARQDGIRVYLRQVRSALLAIDSIKADNVSEGCADPYGFSPLRNGEEYSAEFVRTLLCEEAAGIQVFPDIDRAQREVQFALDGLIWVRNNTLEPTEAYCQAEDVDIDALDNAGLDGSAIRDVICIQPTPSSRVPSGSAASGSFNSDRFSVTSIRVAPTSSPQLPSTSATVESFNSERFSISSSPVAVTSSSQLVRATTTTSATSDISNALLSLNPLSSLVGEGSTCSARGCEAWGTDPAFLSRSATTTLSRDSRAPSAMGSARSTSSSIPVASTSASASFGIGSFTISASFGLPSTSTSGRLPLASPVGSSSASASASEQPVTSAFASDNASSSPSKPVTLFILTTFVTVTVRPTPSPAPNANAAPTLPPLKFTLQSRIVPDDDATSLEQFTWTIGPPLSLPDPKLESGTSLSVTCSGSAVAK